jgi:hypothetical protein
LYSAEKIIKPRGPLKLPPPSSDILCNHASETIPIILHMNYDSIFVVSKLQLPVFGLQKFMQIQSL